MTDLCPLCNGTGRVLATIQSRLISLRKARGLTQEQVCAPLGVSRTQITNLEIGRGGPTVDFVMKAAAFYGVSADYILGLSSVAMPFEAKAAE